MGEEKGMMWRAEAMWLQLSEREVAMGRTGWVVTRRRLKGRERGKRGM